MDITIGQTVYARNDIAQVIGIDCTVAAPETITNVLVQWGDRRYQNLDPNEVIPMTGRQVHAFIVLAEIVYLFSPRSVTEVIAGIRVGFTLNGEHHSYVIDVEGNLSAVGTPSADMAALHQRAIEILA